VKPINDVKILSRFAGVSLSLSKGNAERESAGEILSEPKDLQEKLCQ
jgi:hypothetical protein